MYQLNGFSGNPRKSELFETEFECLIIRFRMSDRIRMCDNPVQVVGQTIFSWHFSKIFDIFLRFLTFSGGSKIDVSGTPFDILFWLYWTFSGDPPKSTFWHFFDIFQESGNTPVTLGSSDYGTEADSKMCPVVRFLKDESYTEFPGQNVAP